jgi:hypothetical protein
MTRLFWASIAAMVALILWPNLTPPKSTRAPALVAGYPKVLGTGCVVVLYDDADFGRIDEENSRIVYQVGASDLPWKDDGLYMLPDRNQFFDYILPDDNTGSVVRVTASIFYTGPEWYEGTPLAQVDRVNPYTNTSGMTGGLIGWQGTESFYANFDSIPGKQWPSSAIRLFRRKGLMEDHDYLAVRCWVREIDTQQYAECAFVSLWYGDNRDKTIFWSAYGGVEPGIYAVYWTVEDEWGNQIDWTTTRYVDVAW